MNNKPIIVLCTTPDQGSANKIAHHLVKKKLAACCNIIAQVTSVYAWKNDIQQDSECLIIVKSLAGSYKNLEKAIITLHPYDVPEIISLDITEGSANYLNWISENVR